MNIGLMLFPDNTQLDLTGPQQVFSHIPGAKVLLVAEQSGPVASDNGLRLLPDRVREDCPALDVLCVPGGAGVNALIRDDAWLDFLVRQARGARWITSVCTGSLALGAAGLLRGYRATTHWLYLDLLEACGALPTPGRVVRDRDRVTGGGVTAGIDIALSLAAELADPETARSIQLQLEYRPQPPFACGHPDEAPAELVRALREAPKERDYHRMRLGILKEAVARRADRNGQTSPN